MNFFDWILTPFGKATTPEPQDHIWDPQTVTMQQPAAPEAPSMNNSATASNSAEVSMRGGGEAGEMLRTHVFRVLLWR
ncbi:hypothetical protein ASPBRDRAFT_199598 [Aspergillus brasiliensis CBS 101740]|uniref:Uncharacterized protein n=1 Tax=Aspergillus brasiliensis (strain CBS 101740 / IMI 381727 / IBT 21946) TaxID=767769 RepID=A0A1L9U887_ASPBC|nr:hypothetical protein ASPBRDRAFT_199598 [Aspergillus brasiliensis CBS 101740]